MVNLVDYYKDNIKKDDYYYRFYNDLITIPEKTEQEMLESFGVCEKYKDNAEFNIYDIKDAIEKFKDLCDPDIDMSANKINHKSFYFLSYYLKNNGYYIEEFPHILDRPPMDPIRFTINDIRNKAFELQLNIGNTVKYQTRRQIIRNFHFSKKNENIEISDDINILFEKISLRNAKFEDMTADEKLCDICNLIENMLSENKQFDAIDYDKIGLGYIDNEIVKRYRKQIQCFRHASEESLNERKKYSENQKNFLIDYGIVIIKTIHALKY